MRRRKLYAAKCEAAI